jgi:hypothetical protein
VPSRVVAGIAAACLLSAACGPSWPARPTALVDPNVPHAVRSIDILPADLQLWTAMDMPDDPLLAMRDHAEAALVTTARSAIVHSGRVVNTLDWAGSANGFAAMDPRALDATEASLSGYGAEAESLPHSLPIPYLPARLGTVTNSDATLYVGGWAFVGKHEHSDVGTKIAEGVLIAVAIVVVVVVVAALAKGGGHGGHGGGGGGHGGGGGATAGHAVSSTGGSVASRMGRAAGSPSGRAEAIARGTGRGVHGHAPGVADDVADIAEDTADAFGHLEVQIPVRPDYAADGPTDGKSQMYLEMTLVDNHTGLAIWHARQHFPASADRPAEVARAARTMLASLPR